MGKSCYEMVFKAKAFEVGLDYEALSIIQQEAVKEALLRNELVALCKELGVRKDEFFKLDKEGQYDLLATWLFNYSTI